jgi:hypothetical protein
MRDHYQVKFQHTDGRTIYGIYRHDQKQAKPGKVIVDDACLLKAYLVAEEKLVDIPLNFGNEYDNYVEAEYMKAKEISNTVRGITVGKLFSTPVGDGCAFYLITDVGPRNATIEWRSYQGDRWVDQHFGGGGSFSKKMLERFVGQEDFWLDRAIPPMPLHQHTKS